MIFTKSDKPAILLKFRDKMELGKTKINNKKLPIKHSKINLRSTNTPDQLKR